MVKRFFKWLWTQLKDKTNIIIFVVVFLVLSSEVWIPMLLGVVFRNAWLVGVGAACWAFWLAPFTPFLPLCIGVTLAVRKVYNIITRKRESKMRLKFKSTTQQPKALLYKRFTAIENSYGFSTVYKTFDNKVWLFDSQALDPNMPFVLVTETLPPEVKVITVADDSVILQYQTLFYHYAQVQGNADYAWQEVTPTSEDGITLLSATFGNISRYQTNRYYYVGSFDYMIKGAISGTETQYIKGNVMPLDSLNIKYFTDDMQITQEDLVVIEGRLFSVENPDTDIKYNPKKYKIHFATLNSVL